MTVEVWRGKKPESPAEQHSLIELYDFLKPKAEHYVILCNFEASTTGEIDLLIIKESGLFIAEIKHCWNRLTGGKEGSWFAHSGDLPPKELTRNPYKQVRHNAHRWRDWCRQNRDKLNERFSHGVELEKLNLMEYVLIFPDLHPDSAIDVGDFPVHVVGLPKFRIMVEVQAVKDLKLTADDMRVFPQLLHLKRWHLEPARPGLTASLEGQDYQPPVVRMLVARGHHFSRPAYDLDHSPLIVGRDPTCEVLIEHESVSRRHAVLEFLDDQNRWVVRDQDSQNGTFVSYGGDPTLERPLGRGGCNALKNGSIVRFGHVGYTVLLDG